MANPNVLLSSSKDVAGFDHISGKPEEFGAWMIGLEAEAQSRNFIDILNVVKAPPQGNIGALADMGPTAEAVSRSLFTLFARRLRGKSLAFVQLEEQGNGLAVLAHDSTKNTSLAGWSRITVS